MAGGLLFAYVGMAAIFAYLAINLDPQEHAAFKILNLIASYLTTILTGLVAVKYAQVEYPDTALAEMTAGIGQNYVYILMFILAYFVLYVFWNIGDDLINW